jgi:hypothetical protein
MASLKACSSAFGRMYACLVKEPIAHWECGEDGIAAIRDGFCDAEQSDASRCLSEQTNQ